MFARARPVQQSFIRGNGAAERVKWGDPLIIFADPLIITVLTLSEI